GGNIDIIEEVKEMFEVTKSRSDDPADGELSSADKHDNSNDTAPAPTPCQGMDLCEQLEHLCLHHTKADGLDINSLQHQL
ncbi:hypothetical protein PAXRUDRAFT_155796, partial [Paxillus rubicundulus Ve08.2h10]